VRVVCMQNVTYIVPPDEQETVCRHPMTADTIWQNSTYGYINATNLIASGFDTSFDARDCPYDHPGMSSGHNSSAGWMPAEYVC